MDIGIRSRLTTGFAAASVGALVMSPVLPGEAATGFNWSGQSAVMLTSATQPLQDPLLLPRAATQAALPAAAAPLSLPNPLNPLIQQVDFHVAFLTDFITTGAVLFGREFAIPGALLQDVHNGTPLPTALSSALQTFAQIELEAGRDLVGFAAQYVSFQLNFLTNLASMVTMPLALANQPTTSLLAGLNPTSSVRQSTVQLSKAASRIPQKVKSSVSVASTQTDVDAADITNHRQPDATQKRNTASTTSSATGGGAQHQPRHDHDGHPKGGGGEGG
jgi:hypothetical protein